MFGRIRKLRYDSGDALAFPFYSVPLFDGEPEPAGGEPTDDADDDTDDDGDDDGTPSPKENPTEKDIAKLLRSARRARQEAAKWRRIAQGKTGGGGGDGDADGGDTSPKGPDFRQVAATTTAYNALVAAGFSGNQSKAMRILRDVDLTTIEPDARGFFDPEDFADVVDEVKDDWPELFGTARRSSRRDQDEDDEDERPRRRAVRSNASTASSRVGKRTPTPDEQFAARLLGSAGYSDAAKGIARGR